MILTVYSFLVSIVIADLFIIMYTILNRRLSFILNFGLGTLLFLSVICLLRMILPIEFPQFQYIINIPKDNRLLSEPASIIIVKTIVVIMIIGTGIRLFKTASQYHKFSLDLSRCNRSINSRANAMLHGMDDKHHLDVYQTSSVSVPMVAGLRKAAIYLPDVEYSDQQLEYILLHEFTHWKNKDLWIKLYMNVIQSFFWWNPFSYLLLKGLDETLELRCDYQVSRNLTDQEKVDYLEILLLALKKTAGDSGIQNNRICSSELINISNEKFTRQRFQLILSTDKAFRRKQKKYGTIFIMSAILLFFLSYGIIVQPYYDIPEEELRNEGVSGVSNQENSYVEYKDGKYYFHMYGGPQSPVEITKEEFESGMYDIYPFYEAQ